jgi:hypothetical protein
LVSSDHFDRRNFIEGANRWNSLPSEGRSVLSVETFKETSKIFMICAEKIVFYVKLPVLSENGS